MPLFVVNNNCPNLIDAIKFEQLLFTANRGRLVTNLAMPTQEASTCGIARLVTLGSFQTEHIGVQNL